MSDKKIKRRVIVDIETDTKTGVSVVSLLYPKIDPIDVKESAHILACGISMLVKSCESSDLGIKSHDLLKEVVDHLHNEYIDTDAFIDANADPIMKVKK